MFGKGRRACSGSALRRNCWVAPGEQRASLSLSVPANPALAEPPEAGLPACAQADPLVGAGFFGTSDFAGSFSPAGLTVNPIRGAHGVGAHNNSGVSSGGIAFQGFQGDRNGRAIGICDPHLE